MNPTRIGLSHSLAALILSATVFGAALPANADDKVSPEPAATRQAHERVWMRFALDKMAERLEIRASQEKAWAAFESTVEHHPATSTPKPRSDANAATLLQYKAERAGQMATRLAAIAKATADLEKVLDPNQRAVLDEIVRTDMLRRSHFERPRRDDAGRNWREGKQPGHWPHA